ncbi:hypothetical protein WOC76_04890 [Methylocystis sp. IM3]|uniref:hypothetical protein n=1 Tax=unclassified Methylocystis TaxID=2625913 RepID=UPI0030FB73DB
MKTFAALSLLAALNGCSKEESKRQAKPAYLGNWVYEKSKDDFEKRATFSASVKSTGPDKAELYVVCEPWPKAVDPRDYRNFWVGVTASKYLGETELNRLREVKYIFDEQEPIYDEWDYSKDSAQKNYISDKATGLLPSSKKSAPDVFPFLSSLSAASKFKIRLKNFDLESTDYEFDVRSFDEFYKRISYDCDPLAKVPLTEGASTLKKLHRSISETIWRCVKTVGKEGGDRRCVAQAQAAVDKAGGSLKKYADNADRALVVSAWSKELKELLEIAKTDKSPSIQVNLLYATQMLETSAVRKFNSD